MDSFWEAVAAHNWTQPEVKLEFRLYHDSEGRVLYYSMEDLPGDYIIVDRLTFDQCRMDVRVKDGKIVKMSHPASWKLVPADDAPYACHAQDACIVVPLDSDDKKFWKVITTHEAD